MSVMIAETLEASWRRRIDDHVQSLVWSPDGRRLAVAAINGPIQIREAASGELVHEFAGHTFGTTELSWHKTAPLLASVGLDGMVNFYDTDRGALTASLDGGSSWIENARWSPDGNWLATAAGRSVRLWSTEGRLVRRLGPLASTVTDIAWKPNGRLLAASAYREINLWDVASDKARRTFKWTGASLVLAWSPNGKYVATGDQDSMVHLWNTRSGKEVQMSGYDMKVRELAWDANSQWLATGGSELITVWDCSGRGPRGRTPEQMQLHQKPVSVLASQHRGTRLASGGLDGRVALWQMRDTKHLLAFTEFGSEVSKLAWSPDDTVLAVGTGSGAYATFRLPA